MLNWFERVIPRHQQTKIIKNPMEQETEATIMLFLIVGIAIFQSIFEFVYVIRQGIFKSKHQMLMKRTKSELKSMLKGVKGISKLNKNDLVLLLV